ncbi:MAG: malate dehydrogenase [Microbacterium sp.]|uniref:malate dehydrogenase n=1 Tax=Microbacterium sp. TaxID=51671 RepID=UPI001AD46343|nr:malate dehydrogenase [Microbacterium sp.]MBN9176561.1 malate dehydrogenase [Microbacterium sp.]
MSILGADAVDAAAPFGRLVVNAGDRVTPLARDRAAELGVEIVEAAPSSPRVPGAPSAVPAAPSAPRGSLPRVDLSARGALPSPPVPALFRRGAPYPGLRGRSTPAAPSAGSRTPPAAGGGRVARVTVVGAGNVGTHAAMRLAETDLVNEVVLVDVVEGLARGVALDLTHAAGLLGFASRIRGESSIAAAGRSDYTIITAGRPRQPGMSRTDLTATNAEIVGTLAEAVGRISPDGVIVVVTNPLDEMTELAWRRSGLPETHVIGMAGLLDSARFQALAALASDGRADAVSGIALGSHGDEMVFPSSQARIGSDTASARLGDRFAATVDRARNSGAEVVGLLGKGSAFITPGLAAARMVESMIRGDGALLSATVRPHGEYGIDGVYVGLPVRLARAGLAEIVTLPLEAAETVALREAAAKIRVRVSELPAAVMGG